MFGVAESGNIVEITDGAMTRKYLDAKRWSTLTWYYRISFEGVIYIKQLPLGIFVK